LKETTEQIMIYTFKTIKRTKLVNETCYTNRQTNLKFLFAFKMLLPC